MLQIVVLRGGALGDIVLTLPILQALRDFYSDCFVTLVAPYPQAILARYHTNRLLDLNSAGLIGLFKPGSSLQDEARECLRADLILSYLSDPDRMIEQKLTSSGTTKFFQGPFKLDLERRPAVEQLAQPLAFLGITSIDPIPRLTPLVPTRPMNRLAIHPGSGSPNKNWPLGHWAELLGELMSSFDEILLISGEADTAIFEAVRPLIPAAKLRLCANRSLWDLVGELSQATLFIGHDSGITHVAAATGVATIALFGPTDPTIWAPNGAHVIVITSPDHTMTGLSVETVLAKLRYLEEKSHAKTQRRKGKTEKRF